MIIQGLLKEKQQNCISIEHAAQTVQVTNTQENDNVNTPNNVQDEEMEESENGVYL